MNISPINSTNFQAKIRFNKADLSKLTNADKSKLVAGGVSLLAGTGSFVLGLDSMNLGVNSGVADKIHNFILYGQAENVEYVPATSFNEVLANTASYAMSNSTLIGPLFSSYGIENLAEVNNKVKKIPD